MIKVKKINFLCPRKLKRYTRTGRIVKLPFYGDFNTIYSGNYVPDIISEDTVVYVSLGEYSGPNQCDFNIGHTRNRRIFDLKLISKDFRNKVFKFDDDPIFYHVLYAVFPTKNAAMKVKFKL